MKAIAVKQHMIHQWNRLWAKVRLEILNVTAAFEGVINCMWNQACNMNGRVSERSGRGLLNIKRKGSFSKCTVNNFNLSPTLFLIHIRNIDSGRNIQAILKDVSFRANGKLELGLIAESIYLQWLTSQFSNISYVLQIRSVICSLLHHCVMCHKETRMYN